MISGSPERSFSFESVAKRLVIFVTFSMKPGVAESRLLMVYLSTPFTVAGSRNLSAKDSVNTTIRSCSF